MKLPVLGGSRRNVAFTRVRPSVARIVKVAETPLRSAIGRITSNSPIRARRPAGRTRSESGRPVPSRPPALFLLSTTDWRRADYRKTESL